MNINNPRKFSYTSRDNNGLRAAIVFFIVASIAITWACIKGVQSSIDKIDLSREDPIAITLMIITGIIVYIIMLSLGWILPFVTLNYNCEFIIHDEGILIRLFVLFYYWLNIPWNMIASVDELSPEIRYGLETYGFPISVIRVKQLPIFWRLINNALKLFAPLGSGLSFPIHPALEHHDVLLQLIKEKIGTEGG
jgi:hypothetical protein